MPWVYRRSLYNPESDYVILLLMLSNGFPRTSVKKSKSLEWLPDFIAYHHLPLHVSDSLAILPQLTRQSSLMASHMVLHLSGIFFP